MIVATSHPPVHFQTGLQSQLPEAHTIVSSANSYIVLSGKSGQWPIAAKFISQRWR